MTDSMKDLIAAGVLGGLATAWVMLMIRFAVREARRSGAASPERSGQ